MFFQRHFVGFHLFPFLVVHCGFGIMMWYDICTRSAAVEHLLLLVWLKSVLLRFWCYTVLVLQAAQIVLICLFELNTPEFTMLLGALPKTFQDGATKLLHNHLKNSSNAAATVHQHYATESTVNRVMVAQWLRSWVATVALLTLLAQPTTSTPNRGGEKRYKPRAQPTTESKVNTKITVEKI